MTEVLYTFEERLILALQKEQDIAFTNLNKRFTKTQIEKSVLFGATQSFIAASEMVAIISKTPESIVFFSGSVMFFLGISIYLWKKLDDNYTEYWEENWLKPYRTLEEQSPNIITI